MIGADLMDEAQTRKLAQEALKEFGKVDVLVNNAGMALYDDFAKKTVQGFEKSMQLNLYAPFLLTQILGEQMAKNKYGKIVNIATIDVMTTYNAESTEYDASKAALISLTKTSSLQFQPYVNVNCVCPGWVATDMNKELPQEFVYSFFTFMFGIFQYTVVTDKQKEAMKKAGVDYIYSSLYDLTFHAVRRMLKY